MADIKLNTTNGSITLKPENGTGNINLVFKRDGGMEIEIEGANSQALPALSVKSLSNKPSGVYWIQSNTGTPFQGYVENSIRGGGWLGIWNLKSRGSSTDKRSYDESNFWVDQTYIEGNSSTFYSSWYKGEGFSKYSNFTEIMIVAHDQGNGVQANYGCSGGAFGSIFTIKPLSSNNLGRTLYNMMGQGNNYRVTAGTSSRGGTVGGDSYVRTSGDVFIDEDYDIFFNSTYTGGSDASNNVRFGVNQTDSADISLNGHNTGGGYGGKHYRNGDYGLAYTSEPQQGYHNSATYISYGNAYQNLTGGSTVWGNRSVADNILYVDFAIFIR